VRESNLPKVINLGMPVFSLFTENLKIELDVIIPKIIQYIRNNYFQHLDENEKIALKI
jgi:hypothetical protein